MKEIKEAILISIIIPHYNSLDTLKRLLKSIPNLSEIEVIVVDDRSDIPFENFENGLLQIKKEYHFDLKVFLNEGIKSAGACRNLALQYACGKWILFADADDYFINDTYKILEKYLYTDNDVVFFTPTSIVDGTTNLSNRHIIRERLIKNFLENSSIENELNLKYRFIVPWSRIISIKVIKENAITFQEIPVSNDVMFSTKLASYSKKIAASNEVLYCVTKGNASLSTNRSNNRMYIRLNAFIEQYKYCKKNLTKTEFKLLNYRGIEFILTYLNLRSNPLAVMRVVGMLILNGIPLVTIKDVSVRKLIKRLFRFEKKQNRNNFL